MFASRSDRFEVKKRARTRTRGLIRPQGKENKL